MHEIVVLSGKGGTGKTSLTAAFAHLAGGGAVLCDLDVDAPDLHLILQPTVEHAEEFYAGHKAVLDPGACSDCGACSDVCRFGAVVCGPNGRSIDPVRCEGCGVCVRFCPAGAIRFPERHCGRWFVSGTRFGPMVHAELFPGAENSGRLVSVLRRKAREIARDTGRSLILSDGPPGIGCPVISSVTGADLVVAVTEPTPSGVHDLERVADLCRHFSVPAGVVVNKADLNPEVSQSIRRWCESADCGFLGTIPYDPAVTEAMVGRLAVTEYAADGLQAVTRRIWTEIEERSRNRRVFRS